MAKKLIRLYEQDTTDFSNNGLKILNPTSAKITRNLIEYTYQLELTHLLDEKGMMLTEERILGYNGQYFRISSIRRSLKEVSIIAKHIFFDLNKNFIEDINIKNKTGSMALSHILGGTSYPHSFSATSDIDTVASSRLVRKNVVSALIGDTDNSFINRWGGELDIDGFTFKLNEQIGKDDGYTIQYGKNLTGLDLQLNMLEVVTRIRPVGFDGIEIDGLYVDSPYIDNYALPIIKEIKYENVKWKGSPNYEEREDDDSYIYDNLAEAQAKLIELATNEFVVNEIDLPKTTINIEFIELSKTEEYKHLKFLQNINIGDTVHIYHKPLDINLKSRCIEYVYDCILNKYETITLGSYTKNFFTKTQNTNTTLDSGNLDVKFSGMVNDILQQTQKHLNDTITSAMGGYVYKTNNALYIMDTDDISTAQKIWVWNRNGLAFSSNGVNGPYTTGITMDGHIVGSMISANSITGEQIQANSIKTANLELSVQKKIQDATNEETVKALIKADLDGFESTLSKEFVTVENATTQIQQATEVAVKEATQSIIDNAVSESMGAVDGQLNDKLNQYTSGTLLPAIAEKAEEVLQNAEDYVVTQLESYATKKELSSSISQTREQIELSVSEKYTTKTESATIITEAIDGITVGAINRVLGTSESKSFKFNGGANESWLPYKFSNDISDKEVFVSFKYTLTGTAQNGSQIEFAPSYLKKTNNQTVYRPKHVFFTSDRLQDVNITDTVSFTTKDFQDISSSSTSYIRFVGNGFTGTLSVSEAQIKQGNSKTSWSPAPEDTITDITNAKNDAIGSANNTLIATIANYYTKSETDSAISVAKDEINLGVSNKYETKTNVETKVSSTLNSAKSYADTKKTEAINSAATDATSKVNAAKSELNTAIGKKANTVDVYSKAEVYTKGQTDSAIKVAKDEINLGVSNTYETKANVETKITSIQVGATNKLVGTATSKNTNVNVPTSYITWDPYTTHNKQTLEQLGFKVGDKVTVGFDWAISKNGSNDYVYGNFRVEFKGINANGTDNQFVGVIKNPAATFSSSNTKGRVEATVTLDNNNIKAHSIRFRIDNSVLNFKVSNVKLEKGTKATSWSPAPEDITTDITTAKNDAISSASTDAANKANNAKNEAINSANATLNSTIANYYTKAQTDSQINVAKEAITQSVSSTYETKTEVTNKINAVQVGTRNLARPTSGDWASRTNFSGGENQTWYPSKIYLDTLSVGDEVTYSFDIEYSGITVNNGASTFRLTLQGAGNSTGWTTALPSKGVSLNIGSGSTRISHTFKVTSEQKKNSYFEFGFRTDYVNGGTIKYRCGMASKGNKVVQWSPAPEDISTNINNAKTDAINAAATDASNKVNSAKNELNTEINKKANSADVYKKTEVYTKNETNSQITTAKNEINQSVSSTYETKTNVTTKIDAIQIGGRNLIKQTKLLTSANLGSWVITNTGNEGFKKLEIVTTNTGWLECQIPLYTEINTITKDVTISFEYHETSSELLMFSFAAYNGNTRVYEITNVTVSSAFKVISTNGSWKTVCYTFNPTSVNGKDGANQYRVQFKKASGKTGTIYVRKPKLELGNKATSWTPAPEDMETTVSGIEQRVSSAESKITDTAITNTVKKNFYTKEETNNQITSKGYQTSSQVQQTVDNLQIKFTESGGYNLLKNGKAALNTNFWASNGGGIARNTHSVYKTCFKTSLPSGIKYNGGDNGGAIRLKNNTHYVYEAQIFSKTAISGNGTVPLHFWCGTTATTAGQSQCTIVDYQQAVPKINTWTKCYVHFLTKPSGEVWFTPFIYTGGDLTGDIWVTELSLSESSIQMPYSPHPSEIYDGITTIDKDGINVSTSYGAHTQFHAGGMSSYNNSNQRTLGIENGGISLHAWNNNALAAYITQSSLWGGNQSANGLAISTTKNGAYLALGTSSLSDVNTTLNMDQALTISANDSFQPRGINFWKDVHAHGYGIRQLSHLKLAGSGAIQFDYLNNSPSTIYEAVDSGHSLYVMGGYQMHLGVMEGSGTPHGVIWMRGKTDTHSYTHWDFHNYTMYNMKTASTYANYNTRRIGESYGVTSNVDGVRYVYRDVELVNGRAIRSIPLEYKGCEYDIVSIVCKGRGNAWVQDEDVDKFVIEGDCQSVNIEIIIHEIEQNLHTVALDEAYVEPLSQKIEPEIPTVITNVSPDTL